MVAYQIESDLLSQLRQHYAITEDEGRTLIQTALQSSASIEPTDDELHVTLTPLSSPHRSKAIAALCEVLNKTHTRFPGSELSMHYKVAGCPFLAKKADNLTGGYVRSSELVREIRY